MQIFLNDGLCPYLLILVDHAFESPRLFDFCQ